MQGVYLNFEAFRTPLDKRQIHAQIWNSNRTLIPKFIYQNRTANPPLQTSRTRSKSQLVFNQTLIVSGFIISMLGRYCY